MPIQLPELDNKSYDDLMKEMIASIPKYSKIWTNFNPSDPGITLLELLAWVTEGLIYRTNQVPESSYLNFLKLVTGEEVYDTEDIAHQQLRAFLARIMAGDQKPEIVAMKAATQEFLSSRYTAVTEEDCRSLVLEKYQDVTTVDIFEKLENLPAGVRFPASIKISYDAVSKNLVFTGVMKETEKDQLSALSLDVHYQMAMESLFLNPPIKIKRVEVYATNYMLVVIIIPEGDEDTQTNFETTILRVRDFLNKRRLLGSFINIQKAKYTDLDLLVDLTCESYADSASFGKWAFYTPQQLPTDSAKIEDITAQRLFGYLSKLTGGPDGAGWPYGRNLVVYELFHELEKIENVKYVDRIFQYILSLPNAYLAPKQQSHPIEKSSDFSQEQFADGVTQLCAAIENSHLGLSLTAQPNTLEWLNELLLVNDLYYRFLLRYSQQTPSKALKNLKAKYDTESNVSNLKYLNRFLLEEYYAQDTPRSLKTDFCAMGYELSDGAAIRLLDDSTWEIADNANFLIIKIIADELKIYAPFTEIAVDGLTRLNSLHVTIKTNGV